MREACQSRGPKQGAIAAAAQSCYTHAMRRLLKFLHTMGALGMAGALAALAVMLWDAPPATALSEYAEIRKAMAAVVTWLFMPSLGATLISGLLAIAANPVFHNAGWAWVKAATGILLFESGFVGVLGPMQHEAENAAKAMAGTATLGPTMHNEAMTIYILLGLATANVVLGVWRPKLSWRPR
jgi:hypothetical protein